MAKKTFADKVKTAIKENGTTQEKIASEMGITLRALQYKLHNNIYRVSETLHLKSLLNIEDDD